MTLHFEGAIIYGWAIQRHDCGPWDNVALDQILEILALHRISDRFQTSLLAAHSQIASFRHLVTIFRFKIHATRNTFDRGKSARDKKTR